MEAREEHLISLKVYRLTRPSLYATLPVACDARDLPGELFAEDLKEDIGSDGDLTSVNVGKLLMLPQGFGNIYLGETFSCYMSVHNDSTQRAYNVSLKADLQTITQTFMLSRNPEGATQGHLDPDQNLDDVIHHEVKETGNHILICSMNYMTENGVVKSFKKYFKFQVFKPLDIKTKFYNAESDEVYLEAQLQCLTATPIYLEKVCLEASPYFVGKELNNLQNSQNSVFGAVNCLNPNDSRQYLFCLTPQPEVRGNTTLLKSITNIGRLDIVWRSGLGERGRLQTSALERMAPGYGDIRLTVEDMASIVELEKGFNILFKVLNSCNRNMDLLLTFDNCTPSRGLLWEGVSNRHLGTLEPHSSIELTLSAVPVRTGLQNISGLRLVDTFLHRTYDYDDIAQVFVSPQHVPPT